MKKTVLFFMLFAALVGSFVIPAEAQAVRHQWYCKHVKNHVQPPLDSRLSFIEEHNAYYIDRLHTDVNAEDKVIYMTFDAGYENGNIEKTLNILRDENVSAAFFILQNLIYKSTVFFTVCAIPFQIKNYIIHYLFFDSYFIRASLPSILFLRRMLLGVISTNSSSLINSSDCSRLNTE